MQDILYLTFKMLPLKSLLSCSLTCTMFYNITKNELIWKSLLPPIKLHIISYYNTYKICHKLQSLDDFGTQIPKILTSTKFTITNKILTTIPVELQYLKNLQIINITNNKITNIPPEICCLNNLLEIRLSHNRITHIPTTINNLKHLLKLYLDDNNIEHIPIELCKMNTLLDCNFRDNLIKIIPDDIFKMKSLRYLDLRDNFITNINYTGTYTKILLS